MTATTASTAKESSEKSDKSLLDSPNPSMGIRNRRNRKQTENNEENAENKQPNTEQFYDIISAQKVSLLLIMTHCYESYKDFYRTNYAALSNDSYHWEWQKCSKELNPASNYLLIGVWEKKNAKSQNILIGRAQISIQQVFAKASQAHE